MGAIAEREKGWIGAGIAALLVGMGCSAERMPEPTQSSVADLSCPEAALSPAPLRRLTRFEYANSVRDAFGVDLPLQDLFPRDEIALGFDNQSGSLSLTDLHVQGYMDAANTVAEWLTADSARLEAFAGCTPKTLDCARALVRSLGGRLERHELSEATIDRLIELFAGDFSELGFREGSFRAVAAVLQNPEFLYRIERDAAADAREKTLASPWTLAARLSFLFWGSVPDEALLTAARDGQLSSLADVEREARRLLTDERARRGVLHFYIQWLELSDFSEVEKDRRLFPFWDDALRAGFSGETSRFLEAVLWEDDARFETLLTAPYTFANAVLSDFYGLPIRDPDARELTRIALPDTSARRGILTHGSILSTQAKPNQTDPIHRGKFIREQFFCTPLPPPPPDLVVSPPRLDPRKSTRERFSAHRADPACGVCHDLVDPVGFVFEHYDAIGHHRSSEGQLPIDATGFLSGTDIVGSVDGVLDLASRLADSQQVRSCVIRQWFRYTFGRGETAEDACSLKKLERVFDETGGNLSELLVALTQTDPFLYATPTPSLEEESP